jgi:hypothetical protein
MLIRVRAVYLVRYLKLKRIFTSLLKKLILHKYLQPYIRDPEHSSISQIIIKRQKQTCFEKEAGSFLDHQICNNMTAGTDKSPVC